MTYFLRIIIVPINPNFDRCLRQKDTLIGTQLHKYIELLKRNYLKRTIPEMIL